MLLRGVLLGLVVAVGYQQYGDQTLSGFGSTFGPKFLTLGFAHELAGEDSSDDAPSHDALYTADDDLSPVEPSLPYDDDDEFDYAVPDPTTHGLVAEEAAAAAKSQQIGAALPQSYFLEIVAFAVAVFVSAVCYFGKEKNANIARSWIGAAIPMFSEQFATVGFDDSYLQCRSWNVFEFYASGRRNCKFTSLHLHLLPRQCPWASFFMRFLVATEDVMVLETHLEALEVGVLGVSWRKNLKKLKSYSPLLQNTGTLRSVKGLSPDLCAFSDNPEIADKLLNTELVQLVSSNADIFDHVVIGDLVATERNVDGSPALQVQLALPCSPEGLQRALNVMVFLLVTLIDAASSLKLSEKAGKELRKNKLQLSKIQQRDADFEREEQLDAKRAKKKRDEEEMMESMTSEQLKKYEEKKHKKSLKHKGPKMKLIAA